MRCRPRSTAEWRRRRSPRWKWASTTLTPEQVRYLAQSGREEHERTTDPEGLRYTKSHEWVRVEGDTVTVGITDHAQAQLTDIVFADLPAAGQGREAAGPRSWCSNR